jgi:DNA-binding transcriptional LysR family regulator
MDRMSNMAVFAKVVECGGFSAAARRLNMSPTGVSIHVQALEDRLGARLLYRTTRKLSLTEVGKVYYERCAQILAEVEEADRLVSASQAAPRGILRLSVGTHIVRFIAPVVIEFLRLYPEASIDLSMGDRMPDLVEEGLDLAVRPTAPPDSRLVVRRLATWRHVLVCAPSYLETRQAPSEPGDLARHNCLRYAYYPFNDRWRFTGPDGEISVQVSGNLFTNSAETLRGTVLQGEGLFLAPSFLVSEDLAAGRLVPLLVGFLPIEFAINAVYPHRQHLSAKVRSFIELLVKHFGHQMPWSGRGDGHQIPGQAEVWKAVDQTAHPNRIE